MANLRLMFILATDWGTISSLVTGAGTLVLAVATFAAVRSSNRSALIAEVALQEQRRPILVPSRFDDPSQKLNFAETSIRRRPSFCGAEPNCPEGSYFAVAGVAFTEVSLSSSVVCEA